MIQRGKTVWHESWTVVGPWASHVSIFSYNIMVSSLKISALEKQPHDNPAFEGKSQNQPTWFHISYITKWQAIDKTSEIKTITGQNLLDHKFKDYLCNIQIREKYWCLTNNKIQQYSLISTLQFWLLLYREIINFAPKKLREYKILLKPMDDTHSKKDTWKVVKNLFFTTMDKTKKL